MPSIPRWAQRSTLYHAAPSRLVCYSSDQVPFIWDRVEWHIKRGLDVTGDFTLDEVLEGLCKRSMQLWVWQGAEIHAALVTMIADGACTLLAVGGSRMHEWIHELPVVEQWAKENGCNQMKIYGRIGWAKALGFTVDYAVMSRAIK